MIVHAVLKSNAPITETEHKKLSELAEAVGWKLEKTPDELWSCNMTGY